VRLFLRRHLAGFVAVACSIVVWLAAQQPIVSSAARSALGGHFRFSAHPVSAADRPGDPKLRTVAPGYEKIRSWISSVGAGTGLFAADGGAAARDLCLVDPRTDDVTVSPVPTSGARYQPFTLKPDLPSPAPAAPMGCLPADFNEDGWQDVLVYYWGRSPVIFLRKPGESIGAQAFLPRELVERSQVWNTNAATIGDYDGDGHVDLVLGNYFPDGARVLDPAARQDELVMNDSLSNAHNAGVNRMFRLDSLRTGAAPDVRFSEVPGAFDAEQARQWTLALGTQDLDGDGKPELYVANDFGPDQMLVNESTPGRIRFREAKGTRHPATPKSTVVGADSFKGMGVNFRDLNSDGMPDVLVSNITEPYALQESNFAFLSDGDRAALRGGRAPYDDHSERLGLARTGWSWDVKTGDFDNNGDPEVMHATGFVAGRTDRWPQLQEAAMSNDLIMANPALWPQFAPGDDLSGRDRNSFFTRGSDGRFVDVAAEAGVGTEAVSRGFAVGDVDSDGREDFVTANQWAPSTLYRNESNAGGFLGLRLRQPVSGPCGTAGSDRTRPAIGAVATLRTGDRATNDRATNDRAQAQQLYPANGHGGVNAPELLFGLDKQQAGEHPVELSWRDGCGQQRSTTVSLGPGWHEVVLQPDATAKEVR
jgi:enediyne biosynthesis protein E4